MTRIIGLTLATILALFAFAPAVLAAEPWAGDEHVIVSTGGDLILEEGQHADLLVVVSGNVTIEGDAEGVVVIDGTATFVGARTTAVVAIRSTVHLDAASMVDGDVHVVDSVIDAPSGTITGTIDDLSGELAGAWVLGDLTRAILYIGFLVIAVFMALAAAGLASKQVRLAGSSFRDEPVATVLAAFAGLVGIVAVAVAAIVTVIGAPLGLLILVVVLPMMLVAGYVVAAIWIGDTVLAHLSPGVPRERPYLASIVGIAVLAALTVIPVVGGLISLIGFGAVTRSMWRTFRGHRAATMSAQPAAVPLAS
jgi:cytoskeletal protein CcmA (bactofilin family)